MSKPRIKKSKINRPSKAKPARNNQHAPAHPTALLVGLMITVAVIVLITHWPVFSAQALLFDDNQYLTNNTLVQNPSWDSARRFLTEILKPSTMQGYYQPLSMISLMVDYACGRRTDDLLPFHRTSLILHVFNTILIIALLYQLFAQPYPAAMAGLLFGVHPMTIETIAWVGERKTLLATFFSLWCMVLYVRHARTKNWKSYILCIVMYVLALMSKPTSTPLPALLLLMDYWPIRRLSWRSLVEKIPLFVIGGCFAIVTVVSQGRAAAIVMPEAQSPINILLTLGHNMIFYLYKILWPANLTSHYPYPHPFTILNPQVLAGVIGTCILTPALFLSLRWTRALLTGWLFFFIAIFPSMGVIGFTDAIAANRFVYLPSLGILLVLTWLLCKIWQSRKEMQQIPRKLYVLLAVVLILAASEATATRLHLRHWKDTEGLFRYMLRVTPDAAAPHYSLATVLAKLGKTDKAIEHYKQALERNPNYLDAHYNLANALLAKKQINQAIEHYRAVLRINPDFVLAHSNLGNALLEQGYIEQTIEHFNRALDLQPNNYKAHNNLANALFEQGAIDEAVKHYRKATELKPDFAMGYKNLGSALTRQDKFDDAIQAYQAALRIQLLDVETRYALGMLLARRGEIDAAIQEFREVLRINPNHTKAREALQALSTTNNHDLIPKSEAIVRHR